MESTRQVQTFETTRLEDFERLKTQLGRGCLFTQIDAGAFHGSYSENHWEDINTLSFSLSVAACIRQACLPEFVLSGCLLSEMPIKINGRTLGQGSFFILMPGANVCINTTGPVTINAALVPASRVETELDDAWYPIRKNITDAAIISPDMDKKLARFTNCYLNGSGNPFHQDTQLESNLVQQRTEALYSMLQRIGADLKGDADSYRGGKMNASSHCILKLIDYFYQHPETPCTIAEMSEIAGMKRRNFFYHFKNFTGYSPYHFFRYIRLQAARQALLTKLDSITALAEQFHFHHHGDFSELYKNTYRELPSATRRKTLARFSGAT